MENNASSWSDASQTIGINNVPQEAEAPKGYVRIKTANRSMITHALVDSGNLYHDLISEELAKRMSLKVEGRPRKIGTASKQGSVDVIGHVAAFKFYIENVDRALTIKPYVVKDLAHHINLGEKFLRREQADMYFRYNSVHMRLPAGVAVLGSSTVPLTKRSCDKRIQQVLDKFKEQGDNPALDNSGILDLRMSPLRQEFPGIYHCNKKEVVMMNNTYRRIYCAEEAVLEPGCVSTVNAVIGNPNSQKRHKKCKTGGAVILEPNITAEDDFFVHPGTYQRGEHQLNVLISNFGDEEIIIARGKYIGTLWETEEQQDTLNALDHRPEGELNIYEIKERINFIRESLSIDNNPMLREKRVQEEVIRIFLRNWDAVAHDDYDFGLTNATKFSIEVEKDARPIRQKCRPLNPSQEADLRRQLDEWLTGGIIEPSMSEWASALVPVKKKNSEKLRWCIDYRALNAVTKKDAYPLGSISNNLDKLSGSTVFTTLDSMGAFHTIPVAESSRDYTSFITCFGTFRFVRVPFGLANASSAYSRLLQMALDRLPPGYCLGFVDDVIIHSKSVMEHVQHVDKVLAIHASMGMKLNIKKCKVFQQEVEYLGHLVSEKGIRMIPSYVEKITSWPLPKTGKELKSFLGFCGYYRTFIVDYSLLTANMNKMKNAPIVEWTEADKENFLKVKKAFETAPTRGYPQYDNENPFILDTDFSGVNIAAVLSQVQEEGTERFIACAAKKCSTAESSYPSMKGELLAVVLGLKSFEHILRYRKFIIRAGSRCITFLNSMKETRGIWARWHALLASFNYEWVHRPGVKQKNADALSRRPGIQYEDNADLYHENDQLGQIDDIYAIRFQEISMEEMHKCTAEDPVLSIIIKYVAGQSKPSKEERKTLGNDGMTYVNIFECLELEDGLLYYREPGANGIQPEKRLCIPLKMQECAFLMCHADLSVGHFGINKTFQRMRKKFYWPNLYHYVNASVNNCVECIQKRTNRDKSHAMQHREQLSYFGQRIYTDTVGPLTACLYQGRTVRHILTVQDGFTRYLVAVPIPDLEAKTVAKGIVEHWIWRHGVPEVIHSDRGTAYTAEIFKLTMEKLNIVKTVTPAYSPEGNRVERAHRVLGDILRSDNSQEEKRWPDKLQAAVFAYNCSVNRMTGVSPFFAIFGRNPVLPVDVIFPLPEERGEGWEKYLQDMKANFHSIWRSMAQKQELSIAVDQAHDQGRKKPAIQAGDVVYIYVGYIKPGISKKLQTRWTGPWNVLKRVSDALYIVAPRGNWAVHPREVAVIVTRMKKVSQIDDRVDLYPAEEDRIDLDEVQEELAELPECINFRPDDELAGEELGRPEIDPQEEEDTPPVQDQPEQGRELPWGGNEGETPWKTENISDAEDPQDGLNEDGQEAGDDGSADEEHLEVQEGRPARQAGLTAREKCREQLQKRPYIKKN